MISQGRIVRIDIRDPGIVTADGARIGMTEKEIKRIYPNVKSEPNHYEPTSHYLSVSRKGSANLIIFDTDGKTVSQYRIGKVPDVQLV